MAQTALVTGATGYVATELVSQLLQKGYNVRGTVRSKSNPAKFATLTKLAEALPGTLELFEADLTTPGSFDAAVKGADYVFHVASPVPFGGDPVKDIVEPAVNGTLSLLSSVVKSKDTVKRVVLTSSVVAVFAAGGKNPAPPANGTAYTEADWNRTSELPGEAYHISKVKAEEAAWAVAEKEGLDLVVLLPSQVLGPVLDSSPATFSVQWFKSLLENGTVPGQFGQQVDSRDIARAHILAAEVPTASGRYIISEGKAPNLSDTVEWLKERFLAFKDLKAVSEDAPAEYPVDNSKAAKELGLSLTPVKSTYLDMAATIIALGIVSSAA